MPKTLIKVYFNNGCTTLAFDQFTTAEDIVRVVLKGRVSLNELRFRKCFGLRSSRLERPFNDYEAGPDRDQVANEPIKIVESFWLRPKSTITEWVDAIETLCHKTNPNANPTDFWKLYLRVRFLPGDLKEIRFKDPVTFGYYYEQIKNDFTRFVGPSLDESEKFIIPVLLELGCLEMRRLFQNMSSNVLDKKINFDYLEKDVGLKRFFPSLVLQQKSIKKQIVKGLKSCETLDEFECMTKYLETLLSIWSYDEEAFKCHLGSDSWSLAVIASVNFSSGISCQMTSSSEVFKRVPFEKVAQIVTESTADDDATLTLKVADSNEVLLFRFTSIHAAEDMASLIDGCISCRSSQPNDAHSVWVRRNNAPPSLKLPISMPTDRLPLRKSNSTNVLNESSGGSSANSSLDSVEHLRFNQIPLESVLINEKLGSGQFGDVYRAIYRKPGGALTEVAIKKLKWLETDQDQAEKQLITQRFIREAKIMQDFDHPHIIKLLGVLVADRIAIVMELAKFGQLRTYLQNHKSDIDDYTLLLYCYQINSAMAYLEAKNYVHRDIAARNILVVSHECVKLSDFGLSREIDDALLMAAKCKMPIKWMAPESINFGKFSSKSDVWMFGICMWEIFSYGVKPFDGVKNSEVKSLIEDKYRLPRPSACSLDVYGLMLECWEYDSSLRPSFSQLKETLSAILHNKKLSIMSKSSSSSSQHRSFQPTYSPSCSSTEEGASSNGQTITIMKMLPLNRQISRSKLELVTDSSILSASPPAKPPMRMLNNMLAASGSYRSSRTSPKLSHSSSRLATQAALNDAIIIERKDLLEMNRRSSDDAESRDTKRHNDNKWLEENLSPQESRNSSSLRRSSSTTSHSSNSIQSSSHGVIDPARARADLMLRDETLRFVKSISMFIKSLGNEGVLEHASVEKSFESVVDTLKSFIRSACLMIETYDVANSSRLSYQIDELNENLNLLLIELRLNKFEKVVSLGLEMAKNANELFLAIARH